MSAESVQHPVVPRAPMRFSARDRLYVVVATDLEPGARASHALHAFREFGVQFPGVERCWYEDASQIAILTTPEPAVLARSLERSGYRVARFIERGSGDRVTAFAVEPQAEGHLQDIPPAFGLVSERARPRR